jgi:endonuclease G
MSPQLPGFNRGVWKRAEELVRNWAIECGAVLIVTGPVLSSGLPTIGHDQVSVPVLFYKVILDNREPGIKGIAFVIPNESSKEPLQHFAVSIDSVEKLTGIDFFPLLPDEVEQKVESRTNLSVWSWNSSSSSRQNTGKSQASQQCSGTTKSGLQCRNRTTNVSGFCYLHVGKSKAETKADLYTSPVLKSKQEINSGSVQCSGTTKKGIRCRNRTTNSTGRCYLHS